MLFLGPPGVGKCFLVQAIGYQAIKQGFVVLYRSIFDVVRDFLHDEALGDDDKVLAKYLKPDLLIVDDMGMKQLPKRSAAKYLFEIIMRRYETRSTMMTSNRPLEDWGKLIGDVPSATAILDRFLHHAEYRRSPAAATGCGTRPPHRASPLSRVKTSQCADSRPRATGPIPTMHDTATRQTDLAKRPAQRQKPQRNPLESGPQEPQLLANCMNLEEDHLKPAGRF